MKKIFLIFIFFGLFANENKAILKDCFESKKCGSVYKVLNYLHYECMSENNFTACTMAGVVIDKIDLNQTNSYTNLQFLYYLKSCESDTKHSLTGCSLLESLYYLKHLNSNDSLKEYYLQSYKYYHQKTCDIYKKINNKVGFMCNK